jgi:predicted Zn-dependent peptidase
MSSYFGCDPGRAEELSNAVVAQLERVAAGNIDTDAFGKAIEALKKNWEESMQSNSYIARNYGSLSVTLDLPLGQLDKRPGLYASVQTADIQDICRRLLPAGPARIILYPDHSAEPRRGEGSPLPDGWTR